MADDAERAENMRKREEMARKLVEATTSLVRSRMGAPPSPVKPRRGRRRPKQEAEEGAAGGEERVRLSEREEDAKLLEEAEESAVMRLSAQPPNIAHGQLRPYQMEGLNWLIQLYHNRLSGILADEMGLGKTLQSISLLAYLRHFRGVDGPHLVVVPLTTLGNWMREFERWCPDINVLRFYGNKAERAALGRERLQPGGFDVCCTSYETVIKEKARLKRFDWDCVLVDEAHRLKNEQSKLSVVMREFRSRFRLLITGTPLQNNTHELWALLNFLLPETFDSSEEFDAMFALDPSDTAAGGAAAAGGDGGEAGSKSGGSEGGGTLLSHLRRILRPFMLRRLKRDVEKSLLPKVETLVFVGMSAMQKRVYSSVLQKDMETVIGNTKERTRLLNMIMQLRKAANHPYLFDGVEDRTLPSDQLEHLVEASGKLHVLDKLLAKLRAAGSRVLIFSQMTRMLDILEDYMVYREHRYCRIDGSTGPDERERQMEAFNADGSEYFCFLLSTRAGGLGINLYTADIVVLYDSDWNPQMDLQAQDRAHRIGQKKQVHVYRFITDLSVDRKIVERAEIKLRLDRDVIQRSGSSGSSGAGKVAKKDMQEMIRYGADHIFRSKDSSITDEDIDLILSRGKELTAEMNEKLQKHVGMAATLALDGKSEDLYTLDGFLARSSDGAGVPEQSEEARREAALRRQLELVNSLSRGMEKRSRKSTGYNVDNYFREAMAAPRSVRCLIKRPTKAPQAKDYQFFDMARIEELCEKEARFYARYHASENPPALSGLSDEEEEERRALIAAGFPGWKRRHLSAYLQACERFGRDSVERICAHVPGQPPEEVRRYHGVFWERLQELDGHERYLRTVKRGEQRIVNNARLFAVLRGALASYRSLDDATMRLGAALPYTSATRRSGFTPEEDVFLLWQTAQLGYGAWDELRGAVHASDAFTFDYFLKSRTPANLHSRVDVLVRMLEKMAAKEKKEQERAVSSSSSSSSSAAAVKGGKGKGGSGGKGTGKGKGKGKGGAKATKAKGSDRVKAPPVLSAAAAAADATARDPKLMVKAAADADAVVAAAAKKFRASMTLDEAKKGGGSGGVGNGNSNSNGNGDGGGDGDGDEPAAKKMRVDGGDGEDGGGGGDDSDGGGAPSSKRARVGEADGENE